MEQNPQAGYLYYDETQLRTLMQRVFLWMSMGLGITGLTALFSYNSGLLYTLASNSILFYGLMLAEVGMVWYLSSRIMSLSFGTATALFSVYSILNGLTLAFIFAVYTMSSIASTFFITAGTFGVMAVFGYVTKQDLSKMRSILMMGLIGVIIASVVNIFLGSSTMDWIISVVGVLLFTGLTAYDVQATKVMLAQADVVGEDGIKKLSVLVALNLYLDFINLFLFLLRLLGSRKWYARSVTYKNPPYQ